MTVLTGGSALVVGGASGIGRASALAFAAAGATRIHLADIHEQRLAAVCEELAALGVTATSTLCDVRDDDAVSQLAEEVGAVDVVMYTPAISLFGPPESVTVEDWSRMLDVNVLGLIRVMNAFVPDLIERGTGHVVITGSEAGYIPWSWGMAPYAASKAAVAAYADALAMRLCRTDVGVTLVAPGMVNSNAGEHAVLSGTEDFAWFELGSRATAEAPAEPEDVARSMIDAVLTDRYLAAVRPQFTDELAHHGRDLDESIMFRASDLPLPPGSVSS